MFEMGQQPNDISHLNQTIHPRFVYMSLPQCRAPGRGGSLAILYSEKWKVSSITVPVHISFEYIALQIKGRTPTILATIYRPSKPNNAYLHEFSAFLMTLCSVSPNMLLLILIFTSTILLKGTLCHALTALDHSNVLTFLKTSKDTFLTSYAVLV